MGVGGVGFCGVVQGRPFQMTAAVLLFAARLAAALSPCTQPLCPDDPTEYLGRRGGEGGARTRIRHRQVAFLAEIRNVKKTEAASVIWNAGVSQSVRGLKNIER